MLSRLSGDWRSRHAGSSRGPCPCIKRRGKSIQTAATEELAPKTAPKRFRQKAPVEYAGQDLVAAAVAGHCNAEPAPLVLAPACRWRHSSASCSLSGRSASRSGSWQRRVSPRRQQSHEGYPARSQTRRIARRTAILAPLRQEAALVPSSPRRRLAAIDYPRVEARSALDNHRTRGSVETRDCPCMRQHLPPWLRMFSWARTSATLRTKAACAQHRASHGCAAARLLTVYDAEDRPDTRSACDGRRTWPLPVRSADLACVQARLAIDNGDGSLLARLFALEYAALFDVLNRRNGQSSAFRWL